jgi:hypothetical protein
MSHLVWFHILFISKVHGMMIPNEDGPELRHVETSLAGVTSFFFGVLMIF